MDLASHLLKVDEASYGPDYHAHLLEQYRLYVEMADRISARRQEANTFFLGINTALVSFMAYNLKDGAYGTQAWSLFVYVSGILLCCVWYRLVRSYRDLNSGKFRVVHLIESRLPMAPYDAEWVSLGEGKDFKRYLPFTHIEKWVPFIFGVIYVLLAVVALVGLI